VKKNQVLKCSASESLVKEQEYTKARELLLKSRSWMAKHTGPGNCWCGAAEPALRQARGEIKN